MVWSQGCSTTAPLILWARSFFVVGAALGTVGYLAHVCTHTHVCTQQAAWLCPVRTWDKVVFSRETWRIF